MIMRENEFESEARAILNRYQVGVWAIELEKDCPARMYADATMRELLGVTGKTLTPEELYRAWYDRVEPHHYDAVADGVDRMINGLVAEIQYPWIHPTRGVMYVRCGAKRDFSVTQFIRLEGTHQDVTELNHVQKESREDVIVREQLNMERRRYMMMCNLIKSAQWSFTYDADGKLASVLWSDEFRHMLGYSDANDFPNTLEAWHRLLHPDEVALVDEQIRLTRQDVSANVPYDVTYRLLTKDRGWRWFRARGELSRTKDGRPIEFAGVVTDVDAEQRNVKLQEERLAALEEVTRTTEQLEKALAEAKRAEQLESNFLATMSHEIRTPLNAIISYAEFLRVPGYTDSDRDSFVKAIFNSSNALLSLINDILDLSKIHAGMMEFRGGACDLVRMFDEMETIFRFNATKKNLDLRHHVARYMPAIALREERLRQILINLIGNAVKFTQAGSVTYSASLVPEANGSKTLEIIVADTGIGIAQEKFATIFDPFYQDGGVRGGRVYQGTGLGLSICKRLLESVNGSIDVKSEVGKGTTFVVRVPNVTFVDKSPELEPSFATAFELQPNFSVLVVDDVTMNLNIVKKHLELLGVREDRIRLYSNARDALRSVAREMPSLILTDMWMPDMNGESFARAVRADPRLAKVPIVAETADADTSNTFDTTMFDAILTKPLTGEKLRGALARLFPKQQ